MAASGCRNSKKEMLALDYMGNMDDHSSWTAWTQMLICRNEEEAVDRHLGKKLTSMSSASGCGQELIMKFKRNVPVYGPFRPGKLTQ